MSVETSCFWVCSSRENRAQWVRAQWGARTLTSKSSTGRSTVDVNPGLSKGSSMESADSTRTNPFPLGDILQRCAPSDLSSSDNWQLGLERLNDENMDYD